MFAIFLHSYSMLNMNLLKVSLCAALQQVQGLRNRVSLIALEYAGKLVAVLGCNILQLGCSR